MPDFETQTFEQYGSGAGNKVVDAVFAPSGGGSQTSIRAEIEKIAGKLDASALAAATAKAAPVDNDSLPLLDSAAGNGLRRVSIINLRNAFKAVFDTLYAAAVHVHSIANITGLQDALNGKAAISHSHPTSQITGLDTALAGKAAVAHGHSVGDVSGLQSTLNSLASTDSSLQTQINGKAATSHTQAISTITGLQTALNGKMPLAPGGFDIGATIAAATGPTGTGALVPGSTTRIGSQLMIYGRTTTDLQPYSVSGGNWIFEGFSGNLQLGEGISATVIGIWRRIS